MKYTRSFALLGVAAIAMAGLAATHADAGSKGRIAKATPYTTYYVERPNAYVGGSYGAGTYAAAPRSYGGDPGDYSAVPVGRPDGLQRSSGCYGGREQVRQGGRLVWVPDVTCPYATDIF